MIEKVKTLEDAQECDKLLTMLINDEAKYDDNCKDDLTITKWYSELYLDDSKMLFVYKENNRILGYIYAKINELDESNILKEEILIDALYILEEERNKGIATKLIEKIKNIAKEKDIKIITINVLNKNVVAKKLYEKLEFNVLKETLRCRI